MRVNNIKQHPDIVYKYRNWTDWYNRDALIKRQVYMAAPCELWNLDDKDCYFDEYVPCFLEDFVEYLFNEYAKYNPNRPLQQLFDRAKFEGFKMWADRRNNPNEFCNQWRKNIEEEIEHIGILSLTDDWRNPKLWEEFGDNGAGYCTAYDRDMLINSIEGSVAAAWAIYTDELPQYDGRYDNLNEEVLKKYFAKRKGFSGENEYRLVNFYRKADTTMQRCFTVPKECIKAIYLGAKMIEEHKKQIAEICEEQGFTVIDLSSSK